MMLIKTEIKDGPKTYEKPNWEFIEIISEKHKENYISHATEIM